jgi:DNA-binding IclR family transcriptional regulator
VTNKSVIKAVRLLRALAGLPRTGATVTKLAKASGISRPTAFRLLNSLERAGLVDRVDMTYTLGWELARLGRHADPHTGLAMKAQPLLQELVDGFSESVFLYVPNATDGLELVAKATGSHVIGGSQHGEQQLPLYASSSGRVLLADMPEGKAKALLPGHLESYTITDRAALVTELRLTRTQGFGIVHNADEGLVSLSQPVRDSSGTIVAILAINGARCLAGTTRRPDVVVLQRMQRAVDQLTDTFWPEPAGTD